MSSRITRRTMLRLAGTTAAAGLLGASHAGSAWAADKEKGCVVGEPTAGKVGLQVLADGGNAVDAMVAAALTAAVAAPYQTGIGGYGGCAVLARAGGDTVTAFDFNSTAPAAARADMFRPAPGAKTRVDNTYGWLAAGVPGILAGLQLLVDRHGTRKIGDLMQPALRLARDGVPVQGPLASTIAASAKQFAQDPGSRQLYFQDDRPLRAGDRFRNPELAELLGTLAQRGSVASFYKGDIAERIAEAFRKNEGLVTARDLAAYTAREVKPLSLTWGDHTLHTAPLTAGGLTVLQMFRILEALRWEQLPAGIGRTQARIEAMRLAWRDRLALLGDPEAVRVPIDRLLSPEYARVCAAKIEAAVKAGKCLTHAAATRDQGGTIHLSAADRDGNFIALTLTHGGSFGARVTVPGLGLTLGHGMSRFDTDPTHPNSPGPGKRPLHNMCPTIVTRGKPPILAVGGRGGRRIPNSMFEALLHGLVLGKPIAAALAAPRLHTEGDTAVTLEKHWPAEETAALTRFGYAVKPGPGAVLSAVALEKGDLVSAMR